MSADLDLDPSDPLNLLLHNTSQSSESSMDDESAAAQDWSKFSSLWADHTDQSVVSKPYPDIMDFSDLASLTMDMDFDPSMTIEPSALHYDYAKLAQGMNYTQDDQFNSFSTDLLSGQFPFTFQSALAAGDMSSASASPASYNKGRRLSITSSSSSSGASLSPVPESIPSPAGDSVQPKAESSQTSLNTYPNDPAAELAQRVRQSAGVMLAVPIGSQFQGYQQMDHAANIPQSKLPIPRLPRHNAPSVPKSSNSSSAASTPPPSTPPDPLKLSVKPNFAPAEDSLAPTPTSTIPTTAIPRAKTSHTTIERRYRTNLNARIQSLRMAVPALRVLEDKEGGSGKKIKKNVKGGVVVKGSGIGIIESEDGTGTIIDVIDERGFVDGVKVARKCSKANVLGKAVEYIRVLKKREHRLKAEQAGLKTLIAGLVGGPALVKEWEKEWRAKFGGEEQDEVEGDDEEGDDEDSDDEEGEEGDEESGKKRKRPKISPTPKVTVEKTAKKPVAPVVLLTNDQAPEKRKRGRPRKVLLPSTVAPGVTVSPEYQNAQTMHDEVMHPPASFSSESQWVQQQHQQPQPQQFLLAVFALFSFFNSPLTSSSVKHDNHHHTGTVLNTLHPPLAYAPDIISQFAAPPPNNMTPVWSWQDYIQIFHLLVSVVVLASFVGSWFGISFGFRFKKAVSARGSLRGGDKAQGAIDWVKMGEQSVIEGKTLSLYERVQIYRSVSRKSETSVGDLVTLALVARATTGVFSGPGRIKARSIWAAAKYLASGTHPRALTLKINEKLVLETLSVDEAFDRLAMASASGTSTIEREDEDGKVYTPLQVLACLIVKERAKKHIGKLFVQVVAHVAERNIVNDEEEKEEEARRMTVDAARELGGRVEKLGKAFERIWKTATVENDDLSYFVASESTKSVVDHEIKALFTALVLYRRVFAARLECGPSSTLLSPPPSPTPKTSAKKARMLLELRKALGNRVFEDIDGEGEEPEDVEGAAYQTSRALGLEDARDRVVDMIVEVERRERGVSPDSTF